MTGTATMPVRQLPVFRSFSGYQRAWVTPDVIAGLSRPHVNVLGKVQGERHWVDLGRHPDAVAAAGVVVVRPESGLFYANADNVHAAIRASLDDSTKAVVLDAEAVPVIDITATEMLTQLAEELERPGVRLLIARDVGQVRDLLQQAGAASLVDHLYPTVEAAVTAARATATDTDPSTTGSPPQE